MVMSRSSGIIRKKVASAPIPGKFGSCRAGTDAVVDTSADGIDRGRARSRLRSRDPLWGKGKQRSWRERGLKSRGPGLLELLRFRGTNIAHTSASR